MVKNSIEEAIIPESPKVIPNEQLLVYVPRATSTTPGIASYNNEHFSVEDGEVHIHPSILNDIDANAAGIANLVTSMLKVYKIVDVSELPEDGVWTDDLIFRYDSAKSSNIYLNVNCHKLIHGGGFPDPNIGIEDEGTLLVITTREAVPGDMFQCKQDEILFVKTNIYIRSMQYEIVDNTASTPTGDILFEKLTKHSDLNSVETSLRSLINELDEDVTSLSDSVDATGVKNFTLEHLGNYKYELTLTFNDDNSKSVEFDLPLESVVVNMDDYVDDDTGKHYLKLELQNGSYLNIELDEIFAGKASKDYVDELVDALTDAITALNNTKVESLEPENAEDGETYLYGKGANGNDVLIPALSDVTAGCIVKREANGAIGVPATPSLALHATSKHYVDTSVNDVSSRVTALEGMLIDFKETESRLWGVQVPEKSSSLAFVQSFANRVSRNRITNTSATASSGVTVTGENGVFKIKGTGMLPTIRFSTPFQDISDGQQYYFGYHIEGSFNPIEEDAPNDYYTLVGPDGPEYGETIGSGYEAEYFLEPTLQYECDMDFTITTWLSVNRMTYEEYEPPENVVVTAIQSRSANVLDMSVVGSRTHSQSGLTLAYDETENCLVLNGTNPNAAAYDAFSVPYNLVLDVSKKYSIAIEVLSGTVSSGFSAKLRFTGSDGVESIPLSSTTSILMTNTPGLKSFTRIDIYIPANGSAHNFKFRLALNEQSADAAVPLPYNDLFKHTYTIPQGIQDMSQYSPSTLTTYYEVESVLSFVDKTISYWEGPFGTTKTKDVSAYLTNGISGLPIPVVAGGIIRFVNSVNAPVTSNVTFLNTKV